MDKIHLLRLKGQARRWLVVWLAAVPLVALSLALALDAPQESIAANTVLWAEVDPPAESGTFPSEVCGDINEDGHLDLIAGSLGAGIGVAAGNGDGTWTVLPSVTVSGTYYGLALGDVDNDGKLDLAGAKYGGSIDIWTGDGAGGWTVLTGPAVGGSVWGVALGDVNHDGKLDLAGGSAGDAGLRMWLGDGAGGWTVASTGLPTSGDYFDLALGDVDRDGHPDLVATSHGKGVRVWQGNGAGSWTEQSGGLPDNGDYYGLALGDLDHDGDLDIVASADGMGVGAWTGSGGASWSWLDASPGLPSAGSYGEVRLGDVDNDGNLDIAATSTDGGVWVWTGDVGGTWTEETKGLPSTGAYYGLTLGDWNEDGMADLSAGQNAGVQAWVDIGTPSGPDGWLQISSPTTSGSYQGLDVGDWNHDGKLDVVAASQGTGIQLWTGDGGNTWDEIADWTDPDLPTSGSYQGLALGDIDHDGWLDVVAGSGEEGGIHVWVFMDDVAWIEASGELPVTGTFLDVDLGDLDNDGLLDIAAVGKDRGVRAWTAEDFPGSSAWWDGAYFGLPASGIFLSVALGDVNDDGLLDIVAGSDGGGLGVWEGNGTGNWSNKPSPTVSGSWPGVAVGDVNGDGKLDVVAAADGLGVQVWAGDGAYGWTALKSPTASGRYQHIDLGDLNNDGKLDVVAGTADDTGLEVWTGDGGKSWTPFSPSLPTSGDYLDVAFGEIDHDGFLDLVGAKDGGGSVHAWTSGDGAPPSGWDGFAPTGWISTTQKVDASVQVQDTGSGLKVDRAAYSFYGSSGTWSGWEKAGCSGSDGTTAPETISAGQVPFGQDSGPGPLYEGNWINFRIEDVAGNVGVSGPYLVTIDTTPPDNPDTFTSSHWPGVWEDDPTVEVQWDGATDATSGVWRYSYVFSRYCDLPDTIVDLEATDKRVTSPELEDGEWYLGVRTRDQAGVWAPDAACDGPYNIDTGPPTNPTGFDSSHEVEVWSNDNTIYMEWWGAEDAGSGVYGYGYHWSEYASGTPDEYVDSTEPHATSLALGDGDHWYFHIHARDRAGNWASGAEHWGPFYIDTGKPTSTATSPVTSDQPDFVVSWSGIDDLSGVVAYDIQVRDLYLGTPWETWLPATTVLSETYNGEQGHTYQFRSRAIDEAGNVELWPAAADTTTAVTPYDFEAFAIEATQAVQDLNNNVLLVAGKRTFVRFHVRSNELGDQGPVEAILTGTRDGTSLGELIPSNPGGTITVLESPDREVLDHSFYFELPDTWLEGTVTLEAEVDPDNDFAESDTGNNTQTVEVVFGYSPEVTVMIVDACYEHGGVTYHAASLHRNMLASWLRRAYPIATLHVRTGTFTPCLDELPTARQVNRILRREMRDRDEEDVANLRYYGMIDDGGDFVRGRGSYNRHMASGPVGTRDFGWDFDGSYGDWYGGHELGHTFKQNHTEGTQPPTCPADCGCEAGAVTHYSNGDISPTRDGSDPNALYGFDVETLAVYPPSWKDFMTYCDNLWVSDYTYEVLRDEMLAEESEARMSSRPATAQPFLEVYGTIITATDEVTLDTFWVTTATWPYTPGSGEYSIRLLDAAESVLADYPFTPLASHLESGPAWQAVASPAQADTADIDEYVPWVAGTRRIAINHGSQELASRLVSAHTPVVALTGPTDGTVIGGGQIDLSWVGSDGDGDPLTYWLEYSTDGGVHWQLLTGELHGNSASLDTDVLAGTSQGKLRLAASDGVNTGRDETQGTFTVWNKEPEVSIVSPSPGAAYIRGQTIALSAQALDLEDGSLTGAALNWHSDLQGALGTGQLVHLTDLSEGSHRITLTATDSDGNTGTDAVTIYVGVSPTLTRIYLPVVFKNH